MKVIILFISLFSLLLFTGCGNYYQEVSKSTPHAIIKFKPFRLGQKVFPVEINGKRPNGIMKFSFTEFFVEPGDMTILVTTGEGRTVANTYLEFKAEVGHEYFIYRDIKLKSYVFNVKDNGKLIISKEVLKQIDNTPSSTYIPIPIILN